MTRNVPLVCVWMLVTGLAAGNAQAGVFEDHFDGPPADDDPEKHGYTITHNYEGPGTKFRTWFYDSAGQPDVMYSSQNGNGFTYSACLESSEVLTSNIWGVTGILVSATKVYDPGDVMEYHFGLIVSTNTALSDSWLILRWMNYGSTPGWGIRYKVSGTVSSSLLASQAPAFSGGETVTIEGNADGTFNLLVDGIGDSNFTIAGLDSRDMKKFGFYGHSANSGTSYAFEYDDLVVTAPAPAQGTIVILR